MRPTEVLVPTQAGLHCPSGAFYIDPVRPVARALVTHAHSDHARSGHEAVLATAETLDLMRLRYGEDSPVRRRQSATARPSGLTAYR
jgi:putative mRNA 3-end processing factor